VIRMRKDHQIPPKEEESQCPAWLKSKVYAQDAVGCVMILTWKRTGMIGIIGYQIDARK
jgi:hypothetical protein